MSSFFWPYLNGRDVGTHPMLLAVRRDVRADAVLTTAAPLFPTLLDRICQSIPIAVVYSTVCSCEYQLHRFDCVALVWR